MVREDVIKNVLKNRSLEFAVQSICRALNALLNVSSMGEMIEIYTSSRIGNKKYSKLFSPSRNDCWLGSWNCMGRIHHQALLCLLLGLMAGFTLPWRLQHRERYRRDDEADVMTSLVGLSSVSHGFPFS